MEIGITHDNHYITMLSVQNGLGAAERGPILMTYKRIAQQRHQRSPLEFLSYIPFYFVVQLFGSFFSFQSLCLSLRYFLRFF